MCRTFVQIKQNVSRKSSLCRISGHPNKILFINLLTSLIKTPDMGPIVVDISPKEPREGDILFTVKLLVQSDTLYKSPVGP